MADVGGPVRVSPGVLVVRVPAIALLNGDGHGRALSYLPQTGQLGKQILQCPLLVTGAEVLTSVLLIVVGRMPLPATTVIDLDLFVSHDPLPLLNGKDRPSPVRLGRS